MRAAGLSEFVDLPEYQSSLAVDLEGYDIVIFKLADGWGALDDTCSHEYSKLSSGEVWNGRVYCEKHGSSFDCRNGDVRGLPATEGVNAYPVEQRDSDIYVQLPDYI